MTKSLGELSHRSAFLDAVVRARRLALGYRSTVQRLLYAALWGTLVEAVLEGRPAVLELASPIWAAAIAAIAFLYPYPARWLAAALAVVSLASSSLALALLVALGAASALLLVGEDRSRAVPMRLTLLAATPWAALQGLGLALVPLAIGVGVLTDVAWGVALIQGVVLSVFLAATGISLSWIGLTPTEPALLSMGGPIAVGPWWEHLDEVWRGAIEPWGRAVLAFPTPYLKLIGMWTFAGLVGGRAVMACRQPFWRLVSVCVAPALIFMALAVLRGAAPALSELGAAVVAASIAWCVASVFGWTPSRGADPLSGSQTGTMARSSASSGDKAGGSGSIRPAKWSDIAGYEDVKREVREALEPLTNPGLRTKLLKAGIEPTRGILLYGPPGTGKTLLGRAAASELGLGFVLIAGPEVLSKWVGEAEAAVRRAFEEAQRCAPSILFFDEIEALVPPRGGEIDGMSGVHRTLVATFLGIMDGVRELGAVVVMAATNAPDQIDPALLRPGRFDRVIYVPAPDPETRRLILQRLLRGKPGAEQVDIEILVKPTERFTGADLAGLVRRAYEATRGNAVTTEQLLALAKATKPTVTLAMLDQYQALAERFGRTSGAMAQMEAAPRPKLTWEDVGGLDEAKQALREAVMLPLEYPDLVSKFGVRPSRGVLLYGPPGTGKTLLARVVADQVRATFLSASGSELAGPRGPETIRQLFARAREAAPSVLFIDEIDAIGSRGMSAFGGTAVHQLLVEMDGVRPAEGLVVVAATNRLGDLDEALLRPGRFDAKVAVGLPDARARCAILAIHLQGKPGAASVDVDRLVAATEGRSGAEIAGAINAAARQAAMRAAKAGDELNGDVGVTTQAILAQLQTGREARG